VAGLRISLIIHFCILLFSEYPTYGVNHFDLIQVFVSDQLMKYCQYERTVDKESLGKQRDFKAKLLKSKQITVWTVSLHLANYTISWEDNNCNTARDHVYREAYNILHLMSLWIDRFKKGKSLFLGLVLLILNNQFFLIDNSKRNVPTRNLAKRVKKDKELKKILKIDTSHRASKFTDDKFGYLESIHGRPNGEQLFETNVKLLTMFSYCAIADIKKEAKDAALRALVCYLRPFSKHIHRNSQPTSDSSNDPSIIPAVSELELNNAILWLQKIKSKNVTVTNDIAEAINRIRPLANIIENFSLGKNLLNSINSN